MRPALAALLFTVAVLAAWWWWWPEQLSAPRSPLEDARVGARAVAAAAQAASDSGAAAEGRELVAAADALPVPPGAAMVDVKVIDEDTREPIAGADVWWTDPTTDARVAALPAV